MQDIVITIPIPVLSPFLSLALAGAAIFFVAWLVSNWPYSNLRKKLPVLHEKPMTNAFVWFAVFVAPFWAALFVLTLTGTFSLWFADPISNDTDLLANRVHYLSLVGLMTALAGLIGAPLAIHRLYTVERQTKATEEGLVTDRINKAVEGLGAEKTIKRQRINEAGKRVYEKGQDGNPDFSKPVTEEVTVPNLEVRIGAIYALERISQDSLRDHIQIMEILCAYVRENSPESRLDTVENLDTRPIPREDIQIAITVLGRRTRQQLASERRKKFRLDLRRTNLSGINFSNLNFNAAIFFQCRLEASIFRNTQLEGTRFHGSVLNYAEFFGAKLVGTVFDYCTIDRPIVPVGGMSESITMGEIEAISVVGANISEVSYLGLNTERVFGSSDTVLHRELSFDYDEFSKYSMLLRKARRDGRENEVTRIVSEMKAKHMFINWFPHNSSDGALGSFYIKFLQEMNLNEWPHNDFS